MSTRSRALFSASVTRTREPSTGPRSLGMFVAMRLPAFAFAVLGTITLGCTPSAPAQGPSPGNGPPKDDHYGATIEDDEAWTIAHPERCATPVRPSDCNGVREYIADFPQGKHAAEAKTMLDGLAAALAKVPEEAQWEAADAAICKAADDVGACEDVAAYLAKFPMGKHAADARGLIDAARDKLDARKKALEDAGVDIELLGTDHTGKDCPPILGDGDHHALCVVLDVRLRKSIKQTAVGVTTDCGVGKGQAKKLYWATGNDLTKVAIGKTTDVHVAVPRDKQCTIEIGIGNVPALEREALRRFCLRAADDPKQDRAEAGSCPLP